MEMTKEQRAQCKECIIEAILIMGSSAALARALSIRPSTVCNWNKGRTIPNMSNALKIQKITKGKIRRDQIRPDLDW